MELLVKRTYRGPNYTIGHLYINGKYFCDTLEDVDRGLTQKMTLQQVLAISASVKGTSPPLS